jgi:ABC-type nitrate/sulfonate/bicarbonate transport system substrate-binding protein
MGTNMRKLSSYFVVAALLLSSGNLFERSARAADTVSVGVVGAASALIWLQYIADDKKFYEKEGLKIDLISVSSSADAIRQITAGSLNIMIGGGLVDPIRAAGKGSSVAIARIEGQVPPYALMAKGSFKSLNDLKGKTISVGGPQDITRIYVDRMLVSAGVKPSEVDYVYAGATAPRFAALQAGAVDAAIVAPPYNFRAEGTGLVNLANVPDKVDLPFSGDQVDRNWAASRPDVLKRFLVAYGNAITWFYNDANRAEAEALLVKYANASKEDAKQSYDFFRKIGYFEPTGKISRKKLSALYVALGELGEKNLPPLDQVILPGTGLID